MSLAILGMVFPLGLFGFVFVIHAHEIITQHPAETPCFPGHLLAHEILGTTQKTLEMKQIEKLYLE